MEIMNKTVKMVENNIHKNRTKECTKELSNNANPNKLKGILTVRNGMATRGITLVALVVTIVVLLILTGITISYIMGDNSVFKKASDAKVQTELGKIEERANLIYTDKLMQNVPASLNNKPTMQEVVDQLKTAGYPIEKMETSENAITGISLSRENMTLGFGSSNTIKVTLESSGETYTYYAVVNGKYYKMNFNNGNITIDRTESDISNTGNTATLNVNSSDETVATGILNTDTNIVNVTATNKAGTITITITYGNYTKTCSVTVKDIPISTALEMNSVRARIAAGYTRWLSAITTPVDALQELEWSSSDESIATVNNNGVVTAKKAGKTTVTAKTIDGSNKEGTCEVTVVENASDVATLTDFQTENTVAKDENGNLITVPGDFKVLVSEGVKVTQGIVIQDKEGNEFVWVPVDSVSTGTDKIADDIRLGRYGNFTTKNVRGNYIPTQDAKDYVNEVTIGSYYQEQIEVCRDDRSQHAIKLGEFIKKTQENGGYYFGRYEASVGSDRKAKTQADLKVSTGLQQPKVAEMAVNMYKENSYVASDLINSYTWDTTIVFIQKYSGDSNYANKGTVNNSSIGLLNSGKTGDEVCNIHDMASNGNEWTTEHCIESSAPCTLRGGSYTNAKEDTSLRKWGVPTFATTFNAFRPFIYIK